MSDCTKCHNSGYIFTPIPLPPNSAAESASQMHMCECDEGRKRHQEYLIWRHKLDQLEALDREYETRARAIMQVV